MGDGDEKANLEVVCQMRLKELLEELAKQGLSQQQITAKAGIPAQYLSDIKHGRRPLTELVARRLGEEFQFNFQWLLGLTNSREPTMAWAGFSGARSGGHWLPCFPHPIVGEPRLLPSWDGTSVEVCGTAAARLALAKWPYIVRFGHDDVRGRLRKGDLILISQSLSTVAEIQIVGNRKTLFLARRQPDETWQRVATGEPLPAASLVAGHCVGIIWGALWS